MVTPDLHGGTMTESRNTRPSRWAPWWAYLVPILALNYPRIALLPPGDAGDAVSVALFAATTVVVVVVTLVHRITASPRDAGPVDGSVTRR
jgi:hypothetical protein